MQLHRGKGRAKLESAQDKQAAHNNSRKIKGKRPLTVCSGDQVMKKNKMHTNQGGC